MKAYGSRPKDQGWCLCHDHWRCRHEKKALKRLWRKRARRGQYALEA